MSLRIAPFVAAWLLTAIHALAALAIGKPEWGFKGYVTPGAFNIVSVEVRNTGATAFDGDLVLDDGGPFGSRSAAPYRLRIFVAPGTARWVQFYPYIGTSAGDWRLTWEEKGREAKESISPEGRLQTGPPAIVMLADPEAPAMRSVNIRVFNEANFPPTVSAADALYAVVLDHQPRWDPTRKEAFLDWLKRGGTIHLLAGPDGAVPVFTDELAVLNDNAFVGAGRIIKHKLNRTEITEKALAEAGFPAPEFKNNSSGEGYYYSPDYNDNGYFETLASVTKPNISWWLIYLLTAIYIILIGPAFYFLRKRDYRVLLAGFLATVAIFAWTFTVVGRRGYGEKQVYHSLAVARNIEGGKWDVRHFVHAFATSGDIYRLGYPGTAQLFAAPSRSGENVRASVVLGKDAHIDADIPLFSARPFIHRGIMPGPDFGVKVTKFDESTPGKLRALTITSSGKQPAEIVSACVQYGTDFYRLNTNGESSWTAGSQQFNTVNGAFSGSENRQQNSYSRNSQTAEGARSAMRTDLAGPLAREVTNDSNTRKPLTSRTVPASQIRVFLYATAPPSFRMNTEKFQPDLEYVLYVLDLRVRDQ